MPEYRTSKQRRVKSKTTHQNNKDVSNNDNPIRVESETQAHQATIGDQTKDLNGNLDSLPTHKEGMNVATNIIEHANQGDNVTNNVKSSWRNRSNDSLISMQSTALGVREHQDNGNDASCGPHRNASSKLSSSDTSKTTGSNDFHHVASQEPAVANRNHVRRNLSVPVTGQTQAGFRSSSYQRKPANSQNSDNTMQRDVNKRHGTSVHLKTGFNKKRHFSLETQPFPPAPYFNIPTSHLFHPNTLPYGPQIPQLNLTEHQRLPIWNIGCDQQSPFPFHQLAHGVYQAGKQLKDKNYGNAVKEKYSRNSNQDHSGKTNRFQNRLKPRHYSSTEYSGINNPLYKYMAQFEKNIQHSKAGSVTYMPEVRSKSTAGNHRYSDSIGALPTESVKHTVASKYGEKRGNQITKYIEYGEIKSQMENNGLSDMKHTFVKAFKLDSNICDTQSIASQADMNTPRDYPNTHRSNQTDLQCGVQVPRSTRTEKTHTGWCHPESCDAETKHVTSCNVIEQTNAMRNHPMHTSEKVQCEKVSTGNHDISAKSNKYSDLPTLPPYFDPTVHPLQVFQKGLGMGYNHRQLGQSTEKPFSECTSAARFIPQNANVSDGCSKYSEYNEDNHYANEHQAPLNVIASSTVIANSKRNATCSGTSSYTGMGTDSDKSTMNPSHVKDMAAVSNICNGTNSSNPGTIALGSTINEEIEEEMRRAQRMSIPVKHGSERYSPLHSDLNPNANEFSPTLTDCNGNQFTMTEQHGVCYFKREMGSSVVAHQESNTSYEHEVAEVLVSTSDNILKTYYTDNHGVHKECGSPFFAIHHQQTESYGSDHPLYGYCAASSDPSFNTSHMVYNTGQQLSPYNQHIPEPTMPASNQIHPADSYLVANNNYFNEACTPFFTPAQSQASNSQISSSEVQMHPQSPYTNPGYTCSFVPMYITPSSAANPAVTFSGTEYCQVLMQNPVAAGVPFTVSVPAHMSSQTQPSHYSVHMSSQTQPSHYSVHMPSQTEPSHYSAPEQVPMTHSAHNYSFQAPVFNLQAYYEATQNNPTADPNSSDHSVFNTDLPNTHISQNIGSYANNRETSEQKHSETTQNENTDSTVYAETCHTQLNIANTSPASHIHDANSTVHNIDHPSESTAVPVSNVHIDQESGTYDHNTLEFDECKILLERLRNREITLEKCRQNISSESEKRYLVEWLELALRVLERNANRLTIDEMVSVMLVSSQRKKTCIEV